jgi:hypothetical protein
VLETILAPVMIVAPFAFGFSPPALVASVVLGVLVMGTALSTGAALAGQHGGLRVSAHASLDLGLAFAAAACSIAFAMTMLAPRPMPPLSCSRSSCWPMPTRSASS